MAKPKKPRPPTKAELAVLIVEIVGGDPLKVERSSNRADLVDLLEQARESVRARASDVEPEAGYVPLDQEGREAFSEACAVHEPDPVPPQVANKVNVADEDTRTWGLAPMVEANRRAKLARAGVTEAVMAGLAGLLDAARRMEGMNQATGNTTRIDLDAFAAGVDWICDLPAALEAEGSRAGLAITSAGDVIVEGAEVVSLACPKCDWFAEGPLGPIPMTCPKCKKGVITASMETVDG